MPKQCTRYSAGKLRKGQCVLRGVHHVAIVMCRLLQSYNTMCQGPLSANNLTHDPDSAHYMEDTQPPDSDSAHYMEDTRHYMVDTQPPASHRACMSKNCFSTVCCSSSRLVRCLASSEACSTCLRPNSLSLADNAASLWRVRCVFTMVGWQWGVVACWHWEVACWQWEVAACWQCNAGGHASHRTRFISQ